MYNWSTDEEKMKQKKEQYPIWRLEQLINFGLTTEKISEADLKKYWDIIQIDPARRRFLSILLNE